MIRNIIDKISIWLELRKQFKETLREMAEEYQKKNAYRYNITVFPYTNKGLEEEKKQ